MEAYLQNNRQGGDVRPSRPGHAGPRVSAFALSFTVPSRLPLGMVPVSAACLCVCVCVGAHRTLILDNLPEGRCVFYKLPNFMQGYWIVLSAKCMLPGN